MTHIYDWLINDYLWMNLDSTVISVHVIFKSQVHSWEIYEDIDGLVILKQYDSFLHTLSRSITWYVKVSYPYCGCFSVFPSGLLL